MTGKIRKLLRKKFPKFMQRKLVLVYVFIILAFVVLITRITVINAKNGDKYTKLVLDQQQYGSRIIPYKRGDIVDRNGTKLATSERVYNVILDVQLMLSDEDYIEPTIKVLEDCFDIDDDMVRKLMEKLPNSRYSILKKSVDYTTAKKFEEIDKDNEKYPNVCGILLEDDYIRSYPYGTLACDVIGFTVDGNVGNTGIESYYNSELNGSDGREYGYLDTDATIERTVKEPMNGNVVVSTIDLQVQSIVEKHVLEFNQQHENYAKDGKGSLNTAVIVMNPQNGEILAEATYPNYDLNDPMNVASLVGITMLEEVKNPAGYTEVKSTGEVITEESSKKMTQAQISTNLNALWKNFCVSDAYEAGSTIKPFTVATGLEIGSLTGDEYFECNGKLHVGDYDIHCINRDGHGSESLKESVENSCNVALMNIAEMIGKEEFSKYQDVFGFGDTTGIDLPSEATGILYSVDNMDPTSLATNSFGQNFTVTMTQMAAAFSSLINGGDYYEPHIVKQIQDENGNVIENMDPVVLKRTISEETSTLVKTYMRGVVQNTAASIADIEGYEVGGKTGTAEKLPRDLGNNLVSFIGYAPQDNPEVVVYVIVDEPNAWDQAQSSFAVQIASNIMKEAFPYLGVTKAVSSVEEVTE